MGRHGEHRPRTVDRCGGGTGGLRGSHGSSGGRAVPPGHRAPENALQDAGAHRAETGLPGDDQVGPARSVHRLS
jgi:hypothetical protein